MRRGMIVTGAMAACTLAGLATADVSPKPPESQSGPFSATCAKVACRTAPYRVQVLAKDGASHYEILFQPQPYVQDGAIVILPGETLVFRVAETADRLDTPVFVSARIDSAPTKVVPSDQSFQSDANTKVERDPKTGENLYWIYKGSPFEEGDTAEEHLKGAPPGTLIVSYHQVVGKPDMVLRVEHNLSKALKYDASIARPTADGVGDFTATSTCPVLPKLGGMESWPYPLGAIMLRNFRLIDTSDGFNCE